MEWMNGIDQMKLMGGTGIYQAPLMKHGKEVIPDDGPTIGGRRLATHTAIPSWFDGEEIIEA